MALIKCEECGKEISSTAKTCPYCGYKTPRTEEDSKILEQKITVYTCLAGIVIGLILLLPALVALLENYDSWTFWYWNTDYSQSVLLKLCFGIALTGGGIVVLKRLQKQTAGENTDKPETEE